MSIDANAIVMGSIFAWGVGNVAWHKYRYADKFGKRGCQCSHHTGCEFRHPMPKGLTKSERLDLVVLRHEKCWCKHHQACKTMRKVPHIIAPVGCETWTRDGDYFRSPDGTKMERGVPNPAFDNRAFRTKAIRTKWKTASSSGKKNGKTYKVEDIRPTETLEHKTYGQ
jgi:hypothetical protein